MISTEHKFIYIHVPKTGGNSIQTSLEPFSDDRRALNTHQDGIDRFNITGPTTSTKHMSLASYKAALGGIDRYFVFFSARHPFRRVISGFFSPSNWARQNRSGTWKIHSPVWNYTEFLAFAGRMRPIVSYVKVDGEIYPADDVIRLESIAADYERITKALGIHGAAPLGHFNATADVHRQMESALRDNGLRRTIEEQFAEDMAFLGY